MHRLLTILLLTLNLAGFCQPQLIVQSKKLDENKYEILVDVRLQKGWHVYAVTDNNLGIESLQVIVEAKTESTSNDGRLQTITDPIFDNKKLAVYQEDFSFIQVVSFENNVPASIKVTVKGFAANGSEFFPIEETKEVQLKGGVSENNKLPFVNLESPASDCGDKQYKSKGLLTIFLIGFGGGLIALLTPCIFPMIPVTVSFFTGKAKTRKEGLTNSILYGTFIFLIYLLASIPFHLVGNINPQIFNIISTNAWVNVTFFAIFVIFALSFFGLFEIKLPTNFANKTGARSGIFFMALTLAIVSFSCTGIILGTLLVNALSTGGSAWQLTAGMAGFGAALALPFALFAMFPQWLKKLPRSGGWLDTVKKTLAFAELALAIKFLSNADLVEHWGILKREIFIGLWLLIALGLGFYLLSKRNLVFAGLAFLFAIYLVPGLTQTKYANLKLLSGFPPPLSYSIYGKSENGLEPDVINDYDKAIALCKKLNKPLLIDFTGWACVNCRKMEEQVWTRPGIQKLIKENYVLVSLYVDDRKIQDGKTVGEKWAAFQAENFKQVTQPLYVILSPDEKLMNHPVGYTPKESTYKEWLKCGLNAYKAKDL